MIRTVRLANWRNYAELDLELVRPVTFLVAPNGTGKTALVDAVRWGLLGTPEDRSRGRAVRGSEGSATVQLVVGLPGVADIEITRTLKRSGATTFRAVMGNDEVDEQLYRQIVSEAWAADPVLLDTLIFGPPSTGKNTGFPIRDHLADIFGVTRLADAATTVKARRSKLADNIKSLRADVAGTADAIAAAEASVALLTAEAQAAVAARDRAAADVEQVVAQSALAARWEQYRRDADASSARAQALAAEMSAVLDVGELDPHSAVAIAERGARATLDETLAATSAAQLRAATASSAAQLLAGGAEHCPTCLRPLTADERSRAVAAHGHADTEASTEISLREQETQLARQRLAAISELGRALSELRPPAEPHEPDPGPDAAAALVERRQRLTEAAELLGAVNSQLSSTRAQLAALRQAAQDRVVLVAVEREDVVLGITERTLNSVASRYMAERIEPLAREINHRWKLVFGSDGLRLDTDGVLRLDHGDVELGLGDFSAGERATALLVTRLLLAASATRVSTMWLDEPLERLDPRRRAAVAQAIVRAAEIGTVSQIVVTTYEEGLARRLEATAPDVVKLEYARDPRRHRPSGGAESFTDSTL